MNQTAVEWLDEQITICFEIYSKTNLFDRISDKIEQAKGMEKQQTIEAYADGRVSVVKHQIISYEDYYI